MLAHPLYTLHVQPAPLRELTLNSSLSTFGIFLPQHIFTAPIMFPLHTHLSSSANEHSLFANLTDQCPVTD
jgi:hypothetical protein